MRRKQLFAQKPHFYQTFPIIFMIYSDTFGCISIFSVTMPGPQIDSQGVMPRTNYRNKGKI